MMYLRNRTAAISLSLLLAFLLASCTGNGDGGSGTMGGVALSSLVVADKVSTVESQSGMAIGGKPAAAKATGIKGLLIGILSSELPATSDYINDVPSVYVNERSMQSFEQVNNILCMVKQTRYDVMVNKGPYIALIDENACSTKRSSANQTTGQGDTGATPNYQPWTVDTYRESASSPQIVRIWFHMVENYPGGTFDVTLQVRVVITESVYSAPPYGMFKIDYKAFFNGDAANPIFRGFLATERDPATGKVLLKYASEEGDSSRIEKATIDKSPDGSSGGGSVMTVESYPGSDPKADRFSIAYDLDHFYRKDENLLNTERCFDRKNYAVSAWRYGLYDLSGNRFNLNSGFTITKDGQYGYIGYWGYWLPNDMTLENGNTVYRQDYGSSSGVPFTVFKADGKLKRHTRNLTTLNSIKNVPFEGWFGEANYTRLVWNGSVFLKAAQNVNGYWSDYPANTVYSLSNIHSTELNAWSQSLGGSVKIKLTGCTYNAPTSSDYTCILQDGNAAGQVIYFTENIVYPNDPTVPGTLACFYNCPDATALTTSAPFKTNSTTTNPIPRSPSLSTLLLDTDYTVYNFDHAANVLKEGTTAVTTTTPDQNSNYKYGIRSGDLFEPTEANMNALGCYVTSTCGWQAGSVLNEFYTWETGSTWSQFTALVDSSGNLVKFDPPIQVSYTHVQPNTLLPDNKYDGAKFFLEYGGFGNLSGIPSGCINLDTGVPADCALANGNSSIQWVPEFTIMPKDPITGNLTEVYINGDPGKPLLVKPLEMEERMVAYPDATPCTDAPPAGSGLTTGSYSLPGMYSWSDPTIGRMPAVSAKPKVIAGEMN